MEFCLHSKIYCKKKQGKHKNKSESSLHCIRYVSTKYRLLIPEQTVSLYFYIQRKSFTYWKLHCIKGRKSISLCLVLGILPVSVSIYPLYNIMSICDICPNVIMTKLIFSKKKLNKTINVQTYFIWFIFNDIKHCSFWYKTFTNSHLL